MDNGRNWSEIHQSSFPSPSSDSSYFFSIPTHFQESFFHVSSPSPSTILPQFRPCVQVSFFLHFKQSFLKVPINIFPVLSHICISCLLSYIEKNTFPLEFICSNQSDESGTLSYISRFHPSFQRSY